MNKLLLLPHIKGLVFALKYSTEYIKFLLYIQKACLNGFNTSICFQNYQAYYFFCSQECKFSTVKSIFQSHQLSQSKKFSKVMEIFHSHENVRQTGKFSTKKTYLIKKVFRKKIFSLIIEIFHKGRKFPQTRSFLDQGCFPQTKTFIKSKEFSANKFQKDSLKAKILDPFNTQSHAKKI